MKIKVLNLDIEYTTYGKGEEVVFIHGWGVDYNYFINVMNEISKTHKVYALNLPGFGNSDKPDFVYNTHNYSQIVLKFLEKLNINNPVLIGHSFGGKVIIDLLVNRKYKADKVILISSSGVKRKKNVYLKYRNWKYKFIKKMINKFHTGERRVELLEELTKKYGSYDYNNAKGIMRDILVSVINEDYKDSLHKISSNALLIWGSNDLDTPLYMGKIMHREIKDSGLVVINESGHFPFITNFHQVVRVIESFINN